MIWDTLFSRHNLVWIFLNKMVICFFIHSSTQPSIHLFIYWFYPVFLSFFPFIPPLSSFITLTPSHLYHSFIYSLTHSFVSSFSYYQSIFTPLLPTIFLSLPSPLFPSFLLFPVFQFLSSLFPFTFSCPFLSFFPSLTSFFPSLAPFIPPLAVLHSP